MKNPFVLVTLLSFLALPGFSQAADPLSPLDSETITGTLENGVRYYLLSAPSQSNRIAMRLVVQAGSLQERPEERGLAHLVEHMQFEGTDHFGSQEIVNFLESNGMKFGAGLNAYTSYESTQYVLNLPADNPEALKKGLTILEDWAHGPQVKADLLEKEKKIILEENRVRSASIQGRINDFVARVTTEGTAYEDRLPIGSMERVKGFTAADIRRFVEAWYTPQALSVVIVGSYNTDDMEALLREAFRRPFANASRPGPAPVPLRSPVKEPTVNFFKDKELGSNLFYWSKTVVPEVPGIEAALKWEIECFIATNAVGQRLEARVRDPQSGLLSASIFRSWLPGYRFEFDYLLAAREGQTDAAVTSYLAEMENAATNGLTVEEFERWRKAYQTANEAETPEGVSDAQKAEGIANWIVTGIKVPITDIFYAYRKDLAENLTRDEVNAVLTRYLVPTPAKLLVLSLDKPGNTMPSAEALLTLQNKVLLGETKTKAQTDVRPLVTTPPVPGKVQSIVPLAGTPLVLWTLSNGIKVYQYPQYFGANDFQLKAYAPGGLSTVADQDYSNAAFSVALMGRNGLGDLNATELQRYVGGKKASVQLGLTEDQAVVTGFSDPSDPVAMERFFQLLYTTFTAPRRDATAEKTMVGDLGLWLTNNEKQPQQLFQRQIGELVYGGSPRMAAFTSNRMGELNLDRAAALKDQFFHNPGDFTFVITGAFNDVTLKPLLEQWLASLPTQTPSTAGPRDRGIRPTEGPVTRIVRAGSDNKAVVTQVIEVPFPYSATNWHVSAVLREVLNIRLREVLRQEQEGTYGVGVGMELGPTPYPHTRVSVNFTCALDRQEAMIQALGQELKALAQGGISDEVFAKAIEIRIRDSEAGEKTNDYWMEATFWGLAHKDDLATIDRWPLFYKGVKKAEVVAMASQILQPQKALTVILNPEKP